MTIDSNWEHVAVLGAAGKMGSGISLLLLQEIANMDRASLTLIDVNANSFEGLRGYLRDHLTKYAEKSIIRLRKKYAERGDLIDNGEIIEDFVNQAMDRVRCATSLEECRGARLIFEAIIEDEKIKADVLHKVDQFSNKQAYFFTNTSSIPIAVLQKKSHLEERLIGFHFYNPPAVQKLIELVVPVEIDPQLLTFSQDLAKRLNKIIVSSNDIAGFIGNGHFIREIAYACHKVEELSGVMNQSDAILYVNRITQDYLLRPMGIFQLIDYVGIDVCDHIATIMSAYLPGTSFSCRLIKKMLSHKILGGQNSDGSQKPGFFKYEKGRPTEVYHMEKNVYGKLIDVAQAPMPKGFISWKQLSRDPMRHEKIAFYFDNLLQDNSKEAKQSIEFMRKSREIAHALVDDGVARLIEDVDTVLQQGFYHLYGVDRPFLIMEHAGGGK